MIFNFTYLVPPSTPQILVQQRVNSYQISLRGPPGDDTFGAPRLGDHYSNQPFVTKKDSNKNGWTGSNENIKPSKNFILFLMNNNILLRVECVTFKISIFGNLTF